MTAAHPPGRRAVLGRVALAGGKVAAEMVAEPGPDGAETVHARRSDLHAHDRLLAQGAIAPELAQAGERFRRDFERARLGSGLKAVNLLRLASGPRAMSDGEVAARERVRAALLAVGLGRGDGALGLSQSCVWFVAGAGLSLEDWALRVRGTGTGGLGVAGARTPMNGHKAAGLFIGALERLALHYRILTPAAIRDAAGARAFREAAEAIAFLATMMAGQRAARDPAGARALEELAAEVRRRYAGGR